MTETDPRPLPRGRDGAAPMLALLAAVLALPATGLARWPFLPTEPAAYGSLLLVVLALLLLGLAPAGRGAALRVPTWLLAAAPFLALAALEGGGLVPGPGWLALAVLGTVLAWPGRNATLAACVLGLLGAGAVLATAGLDLLPAGWNAFLDPRPVAAAASVPATPRIAGVRVGAPVPVPPGTTPALAEGAGPWWVRATRAERPGERPVVLLLDGASHPPTVSAGTPMTAVHGSQFAFASAFDLAPFDAVLVREGAWSEDDPRARARAAALAGHVRKGGLLIGPAPAHAWPPGLARALRRAAHGETVGPHGVRPLGLGRVARAATQADVEALLDARLWVPAAGWALGADASAAPWPAGLERWRDRPARRRTQGILLLVYVAALVALTRLLRGPGARCLGTLLAAGAVSAGLLWTSPGDPGFRVHGVALELGGPGGRRLEAVAIDAGPRGFRGHVRWRGGGVVGLAGGRLEADGRVRVAPGRAAWVLRESDARGPRADEPEDVAAAVLRPLLLGRLDPRRLRYGRQPRLPVRVEGHGPVAALTAAYRAPAE